MSIFYHLQKANRPTQLFFGGYTVKSFPKLSVLYKSRTISFAEECTSILKKINVALVACQHEPNFMSANLSEQFYESRSKLFPNCTIYYDVYSRVYNGKQFANFGEIEERILTTFKVHSRHEQGNHTSWHLTKDKD